MHIGVFFWSSGALMEVLEDIIEILLISDMLLHVGLNVFMTNVSVVVLLLYF